MKKLFGIFLLGLLALSTLMGATAPAPNPTLHSIHMDTVGVGQRVLIRAKKIVNGDTLEIYFYPIDSCMALFPGGPGSTSPNYLYSVPCNSNDTIRLSDVSAAGDDSVKWLIDEDTTRSIHLTGDSVIVETSSGSHIVFKSPDILTIQADTVGKTNILGFVTVVGSLRIMLDTATAGDVRMFLPFDTNLVGGPGHLWLLFWDATDGLMKLYPQDSVSGTGGAAQRLFVDTGDISQAPVPLSDSSVLQGDTTLEIRHEDQARDTATFTVVGVPDGAVSSTAKIVDGIIAPADVDEGTAAADGDVLTRGATAADADWETADGTGNLMRRSAIVAMHDSLALMPALQWAYTATITDSDPGVGNMHFNNATVSSATFVYVDDQVLINSMAISDSMVSKISVSDMLFFFVRNNSTKRYIFRVTADSADGTGYWKLAIAHVANGGVGFSIGDTICLSVLTHAAQTSADLALRLLDENGSAGGFLRSTIATDFTADGADLHGVDSLGADTVKVNVRFTPPTGGTTAPTLQGEILYDTGDEWFVSEDASGNEYVAAGKDMFFSKTIDDPVNVARDTVVIFTADAPWATNGVVITKLGIGFLYSATDTVKFAIHTTPSSFTSWIDTIGVSAAQENSSTTFSNTIIVAGNWLVAYIDRVNDANNSLTIWGTFYIRDN